MNINTVHFGEVEIDQSKIVTFEKCIPGFPDDKEFVLIDIEGNPMFQVLQSIKDEELAFVVTDPFMIYKEYEFDLDDQLLEQLELKTNEHLLVRCMLNVQQPFKESTINLKAPLIINKQNKLAKQVVLKEEKYTAKHPIQVKGGE